MTKTIKILHKAHAVAESWYSQLSLGAAVLVAYFATLLIAGITFIAWRISILKIELNFRIFTGFATALGTGTILLLFLAICLGFATSIVICTFGVNHGGGLSAAQAAPGLMLILCGGPFVALYSVCSDAKLMMPVLKLRDLMLNNLHNIVWICLGSYFVYLLISKVRKKHVG